MAPILFFSYSHVDEGLRNQLEVHLAALKRQGLIATWHDRRITAGTPVGDAIDRNLDASQVILLLVSSDFIASDYCYEREMAQAMERHEKGEARVIPVILRPCDWHDLPFGRLLAAPRDGNSPGATHIFTVFLFAVGRLAFRGAGLESGNLQPLIKRGRREIGQGRTS